MPEQAHAALSKMCHHEGDAGGQGHGFPQLVLKNICKEYQKSVKSFQY